MHILMRVESILIAGGDFVVNGHDHMYERSNHQ
jgi:hypothetical protein